ncbi:tetrahydromethanopterin S-methyltransferase subunit H [Thermodesulfobacteriota bacterium]
MFSFNREQKAYKIGDVEIGGQPGERPTVMIGSIFFAKHQIVFDPLKGIFDQDKAKDQLEKEAAASVASCNPRIIDPIGDTAEALINYIEFLAGNTTAPILVDSPHQNARLDALRHFAGTPVMDRLVYNSIAENFSEEEIECLKVCGIKSAVILAFSTKALLPKDRIRLLEKTLLPAAERAGVENILVDTGVLDLPSVSWAAQAIYEVKEAFGFPAGCAPANALFLWQKKRRQTPEAFQAAAAAVLGLTQLRGADFLLYGPMRFASWAYPACAAVDAMIAYGGKFTGVRPVTKAHPLYKIFV